MDNSKITASVVKKTAKEKFKMKFLAEDAKTVGSWIFEEKFIPSIKKFIIGGVHDALEYWLFGKKPTSSPYNSLSGYSAYGMYNNWINSTVNPATRVSYYTGGKTVPVTQTAPTPNWDNLSVGDVLQANDVLLRLAEILNANGKITLAELYSMFQDENGKALIPIESTHWKWGWFTTSGFETAPLPDGRYLLKVPRPMPID